MIISYTKLGLPVTPEKATFLGEYSKIYEFPSGFVKKEENYVDNQLFTIDYYLDSNEIEEEAWAALAEYNVTFNIITRKYFGNYTIKFMDSYVEQQCVGQGRSLMNADDELICVEKIDMNTNQTLYEFTLKFLGEFVDEQSVDYCKFYYHSDGSFWYCEYNYMHEYDNDEFNLNRLPWIKERFQLSDATYNYYLTATFEPIVIS